RRHHGEMACAGGGTLPGEDPRRGLHARTASQRRQDRQGHHRSGADEALLRAGGQGSPPLQWRRPASRGGRQRLPRRRDAARLGESRIQERQGALGDPGLRRRPRMAEDTGTTIVDFRTDAKRYKHWKLAFDGPVATLAMDVREDGGLKPGYELKLNSYDLGVDIELYDAIQLLRFEPPAVRAVVLTSGKARVFCAGANIRMLNQSSHGWKVNFCKFTNETRNSIEEDSGESGQVGVAAVT